MQTLVPKQRRCDALLTRLSRGLLQLQKHSSSLGRRSGVRPRLALILCLLVAVLLLTLSSLTSIYHSRDGQTELKSGNEAVLPVSLIDNERNLPMKKAPESFTALQLNQKQQQQQPQKEQQPQKQYQSQPQQQQQQQAEMVVEEEEIDLDSVSGVAERRDAVRNAIKHAWDGYVKHAWGHDELKPVSGGFSDNWGGLCWSMVDSIGTLLIAGLPERANMARQYIAEQLSFKKNVNAGVFEANIRVLGGLLSAFELSGDGMYIDKARELADRLLPAFNTGSGLAAPKVNLANGAISDSWAGAGQALLAEVGTLQMEFGYLSQLTGKAVYDTKATRAWEVLKDARKRSIHSRNEASSGLFPNTVNTATGSFVGGGSISMGAVSDSFYEYLLKYFILSGGTRFEALDMYIEAVDAMDAELVVEFVDEKGAKRATLFDVTPSGKVDRFEHLACFVPGMLALGASYGAQHGVQPLMARKERHMQLAAMLMQTCVDMYEQSPSGLAPEYVVDVAASKGKPSAGHDRRYLLRPETVESLFVLYRVTGDEQYREHGWRIFRAIERQCRTPIAYSAVADVTRSQVKHVDNMESFVLAETFKYLYLLFSPDTLLPLDRFVFTTEAHPLRIIAKNQLRKSNAVVAQ